MSRRFVALLVCAGGVSLGAVGAGCESPVPRPDAPPHEGPYGFAHGCFAMDATDPGSDDTRWLVADASGEEFGFTARAAEDGSRFRLQPTDLGTYLFYDTDGGYLVAVDGQLERHTVLESDVSLTDDGFVSPAEWEILESPDDPDRLQLRHIATGEFLTRTGLDAEASRAAVVALYPQGGCAEFPELTLDAEGDVEPRAFEDGSLYGIADTHSHLLSNFAFGGGGVFHGAPFHRLGVEHALGDCSTYHGSDGRRDLFGWGFDEGDSVDSDALLAAFLAGSTPGFNHDTAGYPEFTEWPNAHASATHQAQYYRWLERAYRAGLRLVVQHATSNEVICDFLVGLRAQSVRYSCNDMVAIDRILAETYNMERYIDAQMGGPGRGWFRIVTTPAEARAVIEEGKMAVILGIEVSNLFDCFVVPREGFPTCDEAFMIAQLDRYYDLGVRVMFPVHKYDNAFSAGDGSRSFIELGNFINSGHDSNFTDVCDPAVNTVFDRGRVDFGGLNQPRAEYAGPPPHDLTGFSDDPIATLVPFLDQLQSPALEGDYCQNAGLTPLGEALIREMMRRSMIIEVDHFPRRSYTRVFELLEASDYPAAGTHGLTNDGRIYALGGVSKTGLGRCQDPTRPGAMADRLRQRVQLIVDNGGYPAEGFGFDLNGFAGAPGPRFGDDSGCSDPQTDPITYPFMSFAGDVTFTEPRVGNRTVDFNTEGFVHIGMLAELIEDARHDGVSDEDLEPLFRSAEAYIRMWERAEARSAALF